MHAAAVEPAVLPINGLFRAGDGKSFHSEEKTLEGQLRLPFGGVALSKEQSTETTIVRHEAIPVRALGGGVWKVD